MKFFRVFLTFFLCFFQVSHLFSANDNFLEACLKMAQARDKKLSVAQEQINLAKLRVARSTRAFFPAVSFERQSTRGKTQFDTSSNSSNSTVLSVTDNANTEQTYQSEEIGIRAVQSLYEGGRIKASYKYDSLLEESSKFNYTKIREDLFYNIKLAYYEYQTMKMEFTALQKAFTEISSLSEKVKVEYKAKAISELDLIEADNFREKLENLFLASKANLALSEKTLAVLINVQSLDDIPAELPKELIENVPEVSFTLQECLDFIPLNSVDLKLNQLQIQMADEKMRMSRSKVIPKIDFEGFYGKSGEAYVSDPLALATTWNVLGRLSWSLWGNSLEVSNSQEKTNPNELIEPTALTDNNTLSIKLGIVDDLSYFVDSKESKVGIAQAESDYKETLNKLDISLEKAYNEYTDSLRNERTLKNEIILEERKLSILKKRNQLDEVPTVQLMEESWKHAETISSYGKAIDTNYASVAQMERLVLISLR